MTEAARHGKEGSIEGEHDSTIQKALAQERKGLYKEFKGILEEH